MATLNESLKQRISELDEGVGDNAKRRALELVEKIDYEFDNPKTARDHDSIAGKPQDLWIVWSKDDHHFELDVPDDLEDEVYYYHSKNLEKIMSGYFTDNDLKKVVEDINSV